MTKQCKLQYWVLLVVSILLNVCPLLIYTIKAIVNADLIHEKVTLVTTVFIALILTLITLVNKVALRSRLWILLIGLYVCLDSVIELLIIIACCQIIDELVINPLKNRAKNRLQINKELDRRLQ